MFVQNGPSSTMEKFPHSFHSFLVNPAFNVLSAAFHHNYACLAKLLDVVRNRGRSDVQLFSQLADVPPGLFDCASGCSGRANREEAQEDSKSMRIREGFEHFGVPSHFFYSIV